VPGAEQQRQYYYHSDHLGSAQLITNYAGEEYERLEYTPYGDLWIEKSAEASVLDLTYRFTGKERDEETGNYYYGARYLDPRTGRWLSTDPAMGDYVPGAPVDDEVKKRNGNLPGMGGVFNTVNFHVYHYAGNNPVKYVDPDGEKSADFVVVLIKIYLDAKATAKPNALQKFIVKEVDKYLSNNKVLPNSSVGGGRQANEIKEQIDEIKEQIDKIKETVDTPGTPVYNIRETVKQMREDRKEREKDREQRKERFNEIKKIVDEIKDNVNRMPRSNNQTQEQRDEKQE
jgi:RHS repeat-associated protein